MDILEFANIWNVIGDMPRMTANAYRIYIELCIEGESSQSVLCKKYNWHKAGISNSMKALYDMNLVDCKLVNRKIVYYIKKESLGMAEENILSINIDMDTFRRLWKTVANMSQMSANCFRVYIDICLYGATTQKELWERRGWKIAGVSKSVHALCDWGLISYKEENGRKKYYAVLDV